MAIRFGRYDIEGEIARGGMGVVYLARQDLLGGVTRPVALKLIGEDWRKNSLADPFFVREVATLCSINDPNVVRILDASSEHGRPYLVMEYLDGISLADLRQQARARGQLLDPRLVLSLMIQACQGLAALHRRKVVHRDVSPSNLFLTRDGHVKVIDLGASCSYAADAPSAQDTVIGKPRYMAPEAYDVRTVPDERSDVFSVGIVLWEMLSGVDLVPREMAQAIHFIASIDQQPIPMPASVQGRATEEAVRGALRSDPSARIPDFVGLIEVLRVALSEHKTPAPWTPEVIAAHLLAGRYRVAPEAPPKPVRSLDKPASQAPAAVDEWECGPAFEVHDPVSAFHDASSSLRARWTPCRRRGAKPGGAFTHWMVTVTDALSGEAPPEREALAAWAAQWNRLAQARGSYLTPIEGHALDPHPYFVARTMTTWAERAPGFAPNEGPVEAARNLARALVHALERDPNFVHGQLVAHRVADRTGPDGATEVTLLPGDPRFVRASESAPREAHPGVAPEVREGHPWTPFADSYQLGALLYSFWANATVTPAAGGLVPRPCTHPQDGASELELAVFSALRSDPRERVSAPRFLAMLDATVGATVSLDLPEEGERVERVLATGHRVVIDTVRVADIARANVRLAWCDAPDVMPGALDFTATGDERVRLVPVQNDLKFYTASRQKSRELGLDLFGHDRVDRFDVGRQSARLQPVRVARANSQGAVALRVAGVEIRVVPRQGPGARNLGALMTLARDTVYILVVVP